MIYTDEDFMLALRQDADAEIYSDTDYMWAEALNEDPVFLAQMDEWLECERAAREWLRTPNRHNIELCRQQDQNPADVLTPSDTFTEAEIREYFGARHIRN